MTQLTTLQTILLTTASKREDCHIAPIWTTLAAGENAIKRALTQLLKLGLVEEAPARTPEATWRTDGTQPIGLLITTDGFAALGVEPITVGEGIAPPASSTTPPTKSAAVIALLERQEGATLTELVEATGWLPHSTRAALTGLRKKGHKIDKARRDSVTVYTIAKAA